MQGEKNQNSRKKLIVWEALAASYVYPSGVKKKPELHASFFRLSKLDLSDNKLSRLTSRTFSDSRRLNSLDLSGNNLTNSVGDCALCNTSLHYLSLERNKISQLNHRMFDWVSFRI